MSSKSWTNFKRYLQAPALISALLALSMPSGVSANESTVSQFGRAQHIVGFAAMPATVLVKAIDVWSTGVFERIGAARAHMSAATTTKSAVAITTKPARRQPAPSAVFQSVAFTASSIPAAQKWRGVYSAVAGADFSQCSGTGGCAARAILQKSVNRAAEARFHEKLNGINKTVNRLVRYLPDANNYGVTDYWASPDEILNRGKGDCEDYAILKMAALKEAGLPPQAMSIVVLKDVRRQVYHAVLAVTTSQGHFILDNLSDDVKLDRDLPNYQPLFSVSAERAWIHGIKSTGDVIASAAAPQLDAAPGEGVTVR